MEKIFAGFGEVMLRLAPAGKKRLSQVLPGQLEASFGGDDYNFAGRDEVAALVKGNASGRVKW